jgi:hypothetical protein
LIIKMTMTNKGEGMKGWKERACAALKNARLWAGGDIRTEALNLIAEYESRRAEKRKAREAVDLYEHEDGFDRDEAASDEVDTKPDEPEIPEGWRKLGGEEVLIEGDQKYNFDHFIEVCKTIGKTVQESLDHWQGPRCVIRKIETPQPASLSDEYLALWVPRMEARAAWIINQVGTCIVGTCIDGDNSYGCDGCPLAPCVGNTQENRRDAARAFLTRPDVVAWKERQKWPRWVTVMTPDGNAPNARRLVACYSQGDWDSFLSPALATAAEIDAVRRG